MMKILHFKQYKGRSGETAQLLRGRSAIFSKPAIGSNTMHLAAVNATTMASGAKD
jgi:hypothetical protein